MYKLVKLLGIPFSAISDYIVFVNRHASACTLCVHSMSVSLCSKAVNLQLTNIGIPGPQWGVVTSLQTQDGKPHPEGLSPRGQATKVIIKTDAETSH